MKLPLTFYKKALKDRGIDSMLAEARESNAENDAKYLTGKNSKR
jgi:hypothetical protein